MAWQEHVKFLILLLLQNVEKVKATKRERWCIKSVMRAKKYAVLYLMSVKQQ